MATLSNKEIKDILIKYEKDTVFNNEEVLNDVLKLIRAINFYKRQIDLFNKTKDFKNVLKQKNQTKI